MECIHTASIEVPQKIKNMLLCDSATPPRYICKGNEINVSKRYLHSMIIATLVATIGKAYSLPPSYILEGLYFKEVCFMRMVFLCKICDISCD